MLLIQRNKLKWPEGWKDINQQLQKRSSQDLLRIPRCQGWAEHWLRMSGWRLKLSTQQSGRLWGKPQRLLPGLTKRATKALLPKQNQGSAAAIPSVHPVSPDCEEEGTLLLLPQPCTCWPGCHRTQDSCWGHVELIGHSLHCRRHKFKCSRASFNDTQGNIIVFEPPLLCQI